MKTFKEFVEISNLILILERGDRPRRNEGESVTDYIKRITGKDYSNHPDAKLANDPNAADPRTIKGKETKVSKDVFSNTKKQSPTSNLSTKSSSNINTTTKPSSTPSGGGGGTPSGKGGDIVKSTPGKLSTDVRSARPVGKTDMTASNISRAKNAAKGLKTGAVLGGAIDTALEKSKGSGWVRSLAKGTASALGGLAGGAAGSALGPVGTFAGGAAGSMAAGKAFDVAAGANAKERAAMRQQKRQSQAGGALKGIGGETKFDTKKHTMTTGSGKQRKTVELGRTSVVTDPKTGKKEVGHLAYKDGKAVYKRADTSNAALAKTSSNPLERIGRTLFSGAYKKHDEKMKAQKLQKAATSDIKRQQALGVKGSKNLVGPKIVGPKIVGPKKPVPNVNNIK